MLYRPAPHKAPHGEGRGVRENLVKKRITFEDGSHEFITLEDLDAEIENNKADLEWLREVQRKRKNEAAKARRAKKKSEKKNDLLGGYIFRLPDRG